MDMINLCDHIVMFAYLMALLAPVLYIKTKNVLFARKVSIPLKPLRKLLSMVMVRDKLFEHIAEFEDEESISKTVEDEDF